MVAQKLGTVITLKLEGWTALIWAAHGNQLESVRLLLEHNSDVSIRTKCGKTVFDYPIVDSIKEILPSIERTPSPSPLSTMKSPATPTPSRKAIPYDVDYYYQTSIDGYNHYVNKPVSHRRSMNDMSQHMTPPDFSQLINTRPQVKKPVEEDESEEEDVQQWAESIKSLTTFSWNQCLPDQMFVFSEPDLHVILDHALHVPDTKVLMNKNQLSLDLWQPANILFLGARFAHYYSTRSLLNALLDTTAIKLSRIIKVRNEKHPSFWF